MWLPSITITMGFAYFHVISLSQSQLHRIMNCVVCIEGMTFMVQKMYLLKYGSLCHFKSCFKIVK